VGNERGGFLLEENNEGEEGNEPTEGTL